MGSTTECWRYVFSEILINYKYYQINDQITVCFDICFVYNNRYRHFIPNQLLSSCEWYIRKLHTIGWTERWFYTTQWTGCWYIISSTNLCAKPESCRTHNKIQFHNAWYVLISINFKLIAFFHGPFDIPLWIGKLLDKM